VLAPARERLVVALTLMRQQMPKMMQRLWPLQLMIALV
jgi:hypothetical protein